MNIPTDAARFVAEHTEPVRTALLPELTLHLASEPFGIFEAVESIGGDRPYWAFAWSGGQGLARYILDRPDTVAGKRVLDVGSGSALTTIAAVRAGAVEAVAVDTDPLACAAAQANAQTNATPIGISGDDLLGAEVDADLILIGDLFYEPELVTRVSAFLERAARRGTAILFGDRATMRRPPLEMELIAQYDAALTPSLEIDYVEEARIWRVLPRRNGRR